MLHPLVQAVHSPHDAGVRQVAALTARLAFAFMCATLCWGVFVSTGWVHRLSGRQATRNSHLVLATTCLAFGAVHVLSFFYLTDVTLTPVTLFVPLADGLLRHTAGIVGFEAMIVIAVSVGFQRFFQYRRWLFLHRLAYPAVALLVAHSLFGAIANGHLAVVWLGGITLLVPTVVLAVLRFVPARTLTEVGLVEEDA